MTSTSSGTSDSALASLRDSRRTPNLPASFTRSLRTLMF